jgi:hypothetical protein
MMTLDVVVAAPEVCCARARPDAEAQRSDRAAHPLRQFHCRNAWRRDRSHVRQDARLDLGQRIRHGRHEHVAGDAADRIEMD